MGKIKTDLKELSPNEYKKKWLTIRAYSEKYGWNKDTIYKWVKKGKIEARKFGKMILVLDAK